MTIRARVSTSGPPSRSRTAAVVTRTTIDVHALRARGWTISAIARHLSRDRKTVRAYLAGREAGVRVSSSEDPFEKFAGYAGQRLKDDPHLWASTLYDELIALEDGHRESTESWADLLRSCKRCGMATPGAGGRGRGTRLLGRGPRRVPRDP